MVFRRRRKTYRKKSTLKKRVAKLERNLSSEEKKFDDTSGSVTFSSSGATIAIGNVAQGTDVTQRIGNKIKYTGMQFRMRAYANTSSTAETLRMIIFKDNQDDGSVPLITDLLENNQVESPYKQSNMGRFHIIADRVLSLKDSQQATNVVFNRKLNSICRYNGTTVNDLIKGGIYFAYIGTQAVNVSDMSYYIRLYFTDL